MHSLMRHEHIWPSLAGRLLSHNQIWVVSSNLIAIFRHCFSLCWRSTLSFAMQLTHRTLLMGNEASRSCRRKKHSWSSSIQHCGQTIREGRKKVNDTLSDHTHDVPMLEIVIWAQMTIIHHHDEDGPAAFFATVLIGCMIVSIFPLSTNTSSHKAEAGSWLQSTHLNIELSQNTSTTREGTRLLTLRSRRKLTPHHWSLTLRKKSATKLLPYSRMLPVRSSAQNELQTLAPPHIWLINSNSLRDHLYS